LVFSFSDVTDSVDFQPYVCTLACGLVADNLLTQIHQNAVRLCMPVKAAQSEAIPLLSPICTSWSPDNMTISLGAVGHNLIVVATSSPCFLFILGIRSFSTYQHEIFQMQQIRLQSELSCISIPKSFLEHKPIASRVDFANVTPMDAFPNEVNINNTIIIGTHKPSVEVLAFAPDRGLQILAIGTISLTNTMGTIINGCVPQDVRLVLVDRSYILSGLRNGMLLRFQWPPTSAVSLSEVAVW
jgi:splicing factor 3B subunit 3